MCFRLAAIVCCCFGANRITVHWWESKHHGNSSTGSASPILYAPTRSIFLSPPQCLPPCLIDFAFILAGRLLSGFARRFTDAELFSFGWFHRPRHPRVRSSDLSKTVVHALQYGCYR